VGFFVWKGETMLDSNFLAPYRSAGDPFKTLLARSTYLSKYSRDGETWTDTVRRCVEGNIALDPNANEREAKMLFDLIWKGKGLPPGRGLWTGGVPGIPVDARYNCHYGTLRDPEDWCWVANMLMCGGGVGVGLQEIASLPVPRSSQGERLFILCSRSHPNRAEVIPDDFIPPDVDTYLVDDSREGWVEALRRTLRAAFEGKTLAINVSSIRRRGSPIRTFGGIACGPGPLAVLLREVWVIIRGAAGRAMKSVECLDVTNHIGVCIKSGNVRRSALIVLGHNHDREFRDAKKDVGAILQHRHSSNNSIIFEHEYQFTGFDWRELIEDNANFGEPGILNLLRCREDDARVEGVNPCGEIPLHDREACCLSEVYPALFDPYETENILRLMTRYTLRQRLQPMTDPQADEVRKRNMRIGVGLGGVCDFIWNVSSLASMRETVQTEAADYALRLGVAIPVATTTVKPSGTISLLNESSPGIHAPYAPFYVRRVRCSKDEAMAAALTEAGVPSEDCAYDSTGHTLVFEFPMRSMNLRGKTVLNQTVKDQVDRQVTLQRYWADNSVSSTVSFGDDEKDALAECLKRSARGLKSISCLPKKHGYVQPPYQEIEEDEYQRRHEAINHAHALTRGGDLEVDACETGACPIR
jgi:ribonucleoside-triphosphate reductase (thioredoxin)